LFDYWKIKFKQLEGFKVVEAGKVEDYYFGVVRSAVVVTEKVRSFACYTCLMRMGWAQ
jgi:hypothetical protein